MAGEPLERPRQRGRRGVVARHEQRHELVAQVAVARPVAVLVALLEQHRQHRVVARVGAAAGDHLEQQRVEALHPQPEAAPRAARAEIALHQRHREHPRHRAHRVERSVDRVAQLRRLALAADAEHDPENRLERQPLHALERHDAAAPTAQLLARELRDKRLEARASARRGKAPESACARGGARRRRAARSSDLPRTAVGTPSSGRPAPRPGRAGTAPAPRPDPRTAPSARPSSRSGS